MEGFGSEAALEMSMSRGGNGKTHGGLQLVRHLSSVVEGDGGSETHRSSGVHCIEWTAPCHHGLRAHNCRPYCRRRCNTVVLALAKVRVL